MGHRDMYQHYSIDFVASQRRLVDCLPPQMTEAPVDLYDSVDWSEGKKISSVDVDLKEALGVNTQEDLQLVIN